MNKKKLAILDLGTNTFHLLIAGINGTQSEILLKERFLVKIGKSGINKRTILPEAIQRAVKAIKEIKNILDKYEVHEVRCIATSAIRNATNRQQLIDKIFDHSGINVTIIDGLTEAEYIYYGIR